MVDSDLPPSSYDRRMKRCRICNETKPLDAFYAMKGMRDGYRNECKACNLARRQALVRRDTSAKAIERVQAWRDDNPRALRGDAASVQVDDRLPGGRCAPSHLKRKFGITPEDYERRLAQQGGGCAVCGRAPKPGKSLHVDHDHETGYVRGLLCFKCNAALGQLDDDLDASSVPSPTWPPSDESRGFGAQ